MTIRFVTRLKNGALFVQDKTFETIRAANEAIRKAGATPGQWLDLPGGRIKTAWL